jgi:hypothetical protein
MGVQTRAGSPAIDPAGLPFPILHAALSQQHAHNRMPRDRARGGPPEHLGGWPPGPPRLPAHRQQRDDNMHKFPFAAYAARLPAAQRDTFANFARGPLHRVRPFVERGLERAANGLSLKAAPGR